MGMRAECFSACVWYEEQDYCFCEHVRITDATDNKLRYTTLTLLYPNSLWKKVFPLDNHHTTLPGTYLAIHFKPLSKLTLISNITQHKNCMHRIISEIRWGKKTLKNLCFFCSQNKVLNSFSSTRVPCVSILQSLVNARNFHTI